MSAPDLHPEELLDRAARGALSTSERVTLDEHLHHCTVCRFEQQARADFERTVSPALNVDGLVTRALAGLPSKAPVARPRSPRRVALLVAAATGLVGVTSFAAASTGLIARVVQAISAPPAPPPMSVPAPPAVVLPRREVVRDLPPPEAPVDEPAPIAPPPLAVAPLQPVRPAPAPRVVAVLQQPAQRPTDVVEAPSASQLFSEANEARIRGQRDEALAGYRRLLTRYPTSAEAQLSQATAGRLLLDTGDAQGALLALDAYLHTEDPTLREEALAARAAALSQLGRVDAEAAAWRSLLERYPSSIHAPHARARLGELGER